MPMRTEHQAQAHSLSHQCLRTAAVSIRQARHAAVLANDPPQVLALLDQLADHIERMHQVMRN